jgi:16S rRNA (cytidine1402-2'-O)-methyltransferase
MPGTLYIVATPIGNLGDITLRAIEALKGVDLIAAEDTRHTKKLLSHLGIEKRLTSFFKGNENWKAEEVLSALAQGKDVALVSNAGTPCISDPGYPLLRAAIENSVKIVPIPGPSALAVAICSSGLPVDRFTFVGFLPDKPGKRKKELAGLSKLDHTIVIYVSPWKVAATLKDCIEVLGDRTACLCRELTKVHEEFIRGRLSGISGHASLKNPKGEFVLIIGAASN